MAKPGIELDVINSCEGRHRSLTYRGPCRLNGTTRISDIAQSCRVQLQGPQGERISEVRSNPDGTFEFHALAEGDYRLIVSNDYERPSKVRAINVTLTATP